MSDISPSKNAQTNVMHEVPLKMYVMYIRPSRIPMDELQASIRSPFVSIPAGFFVLLLNYFSPPPLTSGLSYCSKHTPPLTHKNDL